MEYTDIKQMMEELCVTKNWKCLVGLIEDGYKGMFVVLKILRENGKVVAGDLAKKMNVSTARIASALNTLERKNYITRTSEKTDARKVVISLTEEGERALIEREELISGMVAPMLYNLSDDETITLFTLLKKLLS